MRQISPMGNLSFRSRLRRLSREVVDAPDEPRWVLTEINDLRDSHPAATETHLSKTRGRDTGDALVVRTGGSSICVMT
ncbi:hypothetical protein AAHC03_024458 [Spirometra sp. Aus1]